MRKYLLFISLPLLVFVLTTTSFNNRGLYDHQQDYIKYKIEQKKNKKAQPGFPDKAMQWYYEQRAYPLGDIPVNWRDDAMQQIKTNNLMKPDEVQALSWTPHGPGNIGGRIRAIAVHPTNPDIVYLGSVSGGVWKSVNGGASWTALKDHMENLAVCALVLDPSNPDIIYAGTGEGYFNFDAIRGAGIFKSTDAGANWTRLSSTNNQDFYFVNKLTFDNTNNALYAATRKGLLRSTNGGSSFTMLLSGSGADVHCTDVEIAYTSPTTIYSSFGLFNQSQIFRSTDGGNTFAENLSSAGCGRIEIASSLSNPLLAYIAMADLNTYGMKVMGYTTDKGENWYTVTVPGPSYSGQNNYAGTQAWYDNILAVDPDNANTVFAGGIDLWRSSNGAVNWTQITNWYPQSGAPQYCHADFHEIVFAPSDHNIVYLGNDGGIYKSVNRGTNWTAINNNLPITQFYYGAVAQSGGKLYGGTQDNGTIASPGSGNWNEIIGGDGGATEVNYNNPNIVYAEYVNLCFFKSTDGGNNFFKSMNGIPAGPNIYDGTTDRTLFISPFVMDPNNPDILAAGTYRVWKTTNGASSWSSISGDLTGDGSGTSGASISTLAIAKGNSNVIYAGCSNGRVQVTTDNGSLWNLRSSGLPNAYCTRIAIDPGNPAKAFASFSGFLNGQKVYMTNNYGQTWTNISSNLPNIPVSAIFINPSNGNNIIIGTDLGIFTSDNSGGNWVQNNAGLANVPVLDIDYRNDGKIFAATHGRGMYSSSLTGGGGLVYNYIYDDGEPYGGYNWAGAGQGSANRITPTVSGAKLIEMSIYFIGVSSGNAVYKPIVMNSVSSQPGADLVNINFKTASSVPGWDVTDLSGYNIIVDNDFFIGLKYDGTNTPDFGYDLADNDRAWDYNGIAWSAWDETYFMRAAIQTITSVAEIDTRIPDNFEVSANYPNPFNPSTKFRYALPSGMDVKIIIYDISGSVVAELVNNFQNAGTYEVTWNGKNNSGHFASSGVYFYNVNAGEYNASGKMMLLK